MRYCLPFLIIGSVFGSSVLSQKFIERFGMWGGPLVRGPTPPSALVSRVMSRVDDKPDVLVFQKQ